MGLVRGQEFTEHEHIMACSLGLYLSHEGLAADEAIVFLRKLATDLERVVMERKAKNN